MKKLAAILFCFLLCARLTANPLLEKAEKAYDSRQYKAAIEAYERLISSGYRSYQLFFNLGNSYYRNNELGKAIYYYELARKLEPDDEDVRINLAIASSKTIDKIDSKENFFISAVKTNLLSTFSTNTWGWFTVVAITLAAAFFFIFVSGTRQVTKRISFLLCCLFLIGFFITYGLGYSALNARYENKFAIITARETKIMNEPTSTATGKFTLHEGTKVRVVENNGDWLLIRLDNGNEGWV
jgi:tetratricopeptide (TPR) repeat protein